MSLDIIPGAESRLIQDCIAKNGSSPEHNFHYYCNIEVDGAENRFISAGSPKGILAQYFASYDEWYMIGNVLAPEQERMEILIEAVILCLKKGGKFVVETSPEVRKELIERLPDAGYSVGDSRFALFWPVFELDKWDGDRLEGKKWKKMRNIRNKFIKNCSYKAVNAASVDKEKLVNLVMQWKDNRKNIADSGQRVFSKTYYQRYLNFIKNGFKGTMHAKAIEIGGEPLSITGGWEIPNSGKGFYSAIGIYDYRHEGLGEVSNLLDLAMLKEEGYKFVDFGGSPKALLDFKMKFRPTSVYKTLTFPITNMAFQNGKNEHPAGN